MLIVISSPYTIPHEITAICALIEAGLTHFHLRKPQANLAELRAFLRNIPAKYHSCIMLHSHHQLATEFEVKGLHFNTHQPFAENIEKTQGLTFSLAAHQLSELDSIAKKIDYVMLSPIFHSISKKEYPAAFSPEQLKNYFQTQPTAHFQRIALGGIAEDKLALVQEYGFEGAAILGYLWQDFEESADIKGLLTRWEKLRANEP